MRVQRPVDALPVVHLEADLPARAAERWALTVDGHVERTQMLALPQLAALGTREVVWDLHCVWGWSRTDCRWRGVPGSAVAEAAGITSGWVVVGAWGGSYASALSVEEFATGLLATHLDGEPLPAVHGGPLRFVSPPGKWAFKGVKWAARVTATTDFTAGFWESMVGDPRGDMPAHLRELEHERPGQTSLPGRSHDEH